MISEVKAGSAPMINSLHVTADHIGKDFSGRSVWSNISFRVSPGCMVAITGQSGSGKTTLLNCIGLLEEVSSGTLSMGDFDVSRLNRRKKKLFYRNVLGFLFQNYGLVESWSVNKNLSIALEYSKLDRNEGRIAKQRALEKVNLSEIKDERIFTLSGGEQQRVALARLLLKRPSIILADEPTGALDDKNSQVVMDVLRECSSAGVSVLISTHDNRVVDRCDDSISL